MAAKLLEISKVCNRLLSKKLLHHPLEQAVLYRVSPTFKFRAKEATRLANRLPGASLRANNKQSQLLS
jgi:hypothetical protein